MPLSRSVSELYIFHTEVDFTEPLHCKQTHHPIMMVVWSRRHFSRNKLIVDVSQHQALFVKWRSISRTICYLYKSLQLSGTICGTVSTLLWEGETLPIYLYCTQNLLSVLSKLFSVHFSPHVCFFVSQIHVTSGVKSFNPNILRFRGIYSVCKGL